MKLLARQSSLQHMLLEEGVEIIKNASGLGFVRSPGLGTSAFRFSIQLHITSQSLPSVGTVKQGR